MQRDPARRHITAAVVALVLAACAVSGLGVGFASHLALRGLGLAAPAPSSTARATQTTAASASPSPSATAGATDSPTTTSAFTLKVTVSPKILNPGERFTVMALATATNGGVPVPGVTCVMQSPPGAHNPLYSQWPAPQETNASGQAVWSLSAPPKPPGTYVLAVNAHDAHGSRFVWIATVTLRA